MILFLRRIVYLFIFTFTYSFFAQQITTSSLDSIIKSELSFEQKKGFVDSITTIENFPQEKLSYLYHSYARFLSNNSKKKGAIEYIGKAIEIRKKNQQNDLESLKKSLFNLGLYLRKSGKYFKSIDIFKELSELPQEDRLCIKAYSELIILYYKVGDFEKSMNHFNKSTKFYIFKSDYRNLYKNYMRMSSVYASMDTKKYSPEIIKYLDKVDSLKKFIEIDTRDKMLINIDFGNVYEKLNQTQKALQYYTKALEYSKKLKDSISISMLNNNIGHLYLNNSLHHKAKQVLQKSVLFSKNSKDSRALSYNTFAEYYNQVNDFEMAKIYFQKAIQLLVSGDEIKEYHNPTIGELSINSNKLRLFDFICQKAIYWIERYKNENSKQYLINSLEDFKLADQLLDVIRFESSEKISKLFWREKGANLYIKAVEVSYLLGDVKSAYLFMEKNKALLLLEELIDQQAKVLTNLPQNLIERDFLFRQKIVEIEENEMVNKADAIFELKRGYEQFKDSIATQYPSYSKLRKSLPVLSIQSHKNNFINNNIATLQFIISDNIAYGLAITKEKTVLYPIKDAQILKNEIIELTGQLQAPFNTQDEVNKYVINANSIFNKLIPSEIFKSIKGKKTIIAADGILQNIPFEALITNVVNQNSYLIHINEINYVYSFSYLFSNGKKTRNPENIFLGFAPEKFKEVSLAKLPNSINELKKINSIFSDKIYINDEASILNFKSNFEKHKIIHLATHSGSNNGEKPWLAFSDGKVNLNELYATQNQADLVVLSACKTSQGEMKTGEGVMSLARGFFFSGTNSVVSTLWNINDKTTQEIMNSFYQNIKKGKSKSKALHDSKLEYLSVNKGSMASPYYWSSFVLIGDSGVVFIPDDTKFNWIIILLLLVVIILVGIAFKKRNKK